MAESSTEYVLDDAGWDEATRLAATHDGLVLVAPAAMTAETDIPWHRRDSWPPEVTQAARRLRDRFVPEDKRALDDMQTGVKYLPDDQARDDFVTFALRVRRNSVGRRADAGEPGRRGSVARCVADRRAARCP